MPSMRINGLEIAYTDEGSGPDVVLFVHGHPFDHSMWGPQIAFFADRGWRVVAPDLRGYGASEAGQGPSRLETFCVDIIALLNELDVEKVVVVGLSMGGQIAMEFCRSHRSRLRGVVFAATFPQSETPAGKQFRYETADRIERDGMDAYASELLPKMLAPQTLTQNRPLADYVLAMMQRAPAGGSAAALRGRAERVDYRATLEELDLPTLIVSGGQDAFTSRAEVEEMQRLARSSKLIWMPEVGHMPNLEAEDAFNAALQEFLNDIPRCA